MKNRDLTISNLGFIGALLIVLYHLCPQVSSNWQGIIIDYLYGPIGILVMAVPMFFGISGYLLVNHLDDNNWWEQAVIKRIKSLLVPFYIWTIILFVSKSVFYCIQCYYGYSPVTPTPIPNGITWGIVELFGCDFFHLTGIVWYLRTLFLYVVISPIFVWIAKRKISIIFILVLIVVYRYGPNSPTKIPIIDEFLANGIYSQGMLPFFLGICLRIKANIRGIITNTNIVIPFVTLIVLSIVYIKIPNTFLAYLVSMINVLCLYLFAKHIKIPISLARLSMPIYLSHMIYKWCFDTLVFLIFGKELISNFCLWPIKYIVICSLSILTAIIIKAKYSYVYSVIYGGR